MKENNTAKEEYQYHLKDHLGNVRLTFTTAESTTTMYMATMETDNAEYEEQAFGNVDETRQIDQLYNHTEDGNTSARLNAVEDRAMGPWTGVRVMPGDTVRMKVFAKYNQPTKTREAIAGMAGIIAATVTGGAGDIDGLQQVTREIGETLKGGQATLLAKNNNVPKAYLNYIFFDKEMKSKETNFRQVTEAAHGSFEELEMEFVAEEEGYLMAYTTNETNEDLDVFMDDFTIMHTTGPIVRVDDYYPFGMIYGTSELDNKLTNRFLYNGKELQSDLALDWYDYGARMYDAAVGRWHVVDPLADSFRIFSPYNYVLNNPITLIDPDGKDVVFYNNVGTELGRIVLKHIDYKVHLDVSYSLNEPIVIDPSQLAEQLGFPNIDAVGIGIEGSGTLGGGINYGVELVYFLNGENKGELFAYRKLGLNAGIEASGGVYGLAAYNHKRNFGADSWLGKSNSYNFGLWGASYSTFWSNTEGAYDLWKRQSDRRLTWEGKTLGSGPIRMNAGVKWSGTTYKYLYDKPLISTTGSSNGIINLNF